ncbi:MAG: FprA family A-type flavoprotein [Velocimicrobium sp.]
MSDMNISNDIFYIGVNDRTLDLFESQYKVPNGVSYNSYVILDEKVTIMDTVDKRATSEWLVNLEQALNGRSVDYLVVSHMEPDHAANIQVLAEKYPNMKVIGNVKTFTMISQFFDIDLSNRSVIVKEGDTISLGRHQLQFFMAPMVHWPEVMVTYESTSKILFSADGFGKFGTLDMEDKWEEEARRYYMNILGKYGSAVQTLLKKLDAIDISMICPLHGPILKDDLAFYLGKYKIWSSYQPEEEGTLIAYASIHGNTGIAARKLADILIQMGKKNILVRDLSRSDSSEVVTKAFQYSNLVVAAASYDAGVFPCMEEFLLHLKAKNFQKRKVGIIENGSWVPKAGVCMKEILQQMKEIEMPDEIITIKSTLKAENMDKFNELANWL